MNGEQFKTALSKAKRGEAIAYHSGLLMRDRLFKPDVADVGNAAWKAYEAGECVLFQRRVDMSTCQYLAVRLAHAGKPKETVVS
jgi:hypothetical protein